LLELEDLLAQQHKLKGFRANFVTNSKAQFTGPNNSSRDLSNQVDFALLLNLRSLTDVIVTDAATARAENYKPSKWAPIQAWSSSGNFVGVDGGIAQRKIDNLQESLKQIRENFESVLFETGPTLTQLLGKLFEIDQLKLTVVESPGLQAARSAAAITLDKLALNYLKESSVFTVAGTHFFTFDR
jgi:hypothetical protein